MLALNEVNFDEIYDQVFYMSEELDEKIIDEIIVEGIIPDKVRKRAKEIINKYGKIDPRKRIKEVESKLKAQKVSVSKIKNIATKHSKAAVKEAKPHIKNVKKVAGIMKKHYRAAETEVQGLPEAEKWALSVFLLISIILIHQILLPVLVLSATALGLPPIAGFAALAVFIAPLTEETAKFITIKRRATGQFFTVFNITEFTLWMGQLMSMGIPVGIAVIGRLMAVGLHGLTTWIQWSHRKEGELKGEKDDKTAKKGLGIAMLVHSGWNFLSVLGRF